MERNLVTAVPHICIENGPSKGKRFSLQGQDSHIGGRDAGVNIPIPDPLVSRQHFRIDQEKNQFFLKDLGVSHL